MPAYEMRISDWCSDVCSSGLRVDPAALGLADLGRPDGYVSRQVERWTRQYRASERTRIAPMEEAIAWIGGHAPQGEAGVLIHGDFRLDNLIFDARAPRIAAIGRASCRGRVCQSGEILVVAR